MKTSRLVCWTYGFCPSVVTYGLSLSADGDRSIMAQSSRTASLLSLVICLSVEQASSLSRADDAEITVRTAQPRQRHLLYVTDAV